MPSDIGRLKAAKSMNEKCEAMKELRATFYEKPEESPLRALFKEDRELSGKRSDNLKWKDMRSILSISLMRDNSIS